MALLGTSCLGAAAQPMADTLRLQTRNVQVTRSEGKVYVRFSLMLDEVEVASNRALRLTPALVSGDSVRALAPVTVAGRRQAIMHERRHRGGQLVRRDKGRPQSVEYADAVDYEDWMNGARLVVAEDLCGCGGSPLEQRQLPVRDLCFEVAVYEVTPVLAFAAPRVEAVKHREESGQAFLDFPVNQTVIYPEYRRNVAELEKIRKTVELVRNDSNTTITHIDIHGYASPEGSYANNRRLAQGRAEALQQYVRGQYAFSDTVFSVKSTPEDWQGLQRWVEQSQLDRRDEVLGIIGASIDEDAKNARLQQLGDGSTYRYLLQQVYPALRHSDYTVHYTVRPFSVEEARRLLRTRPQLLSLDEMYRVAQTYEPGSHDFNEVFDIAVRLFPEDETANLNAALVAVGERNYGRAARYLERAGDSPEAVHARGILCLVNGEYDKAETLLRQAEQQGVKQAADNLEQLRLKRENDRQRAAVGQ